MPKNIIHIGANKTGSTTLQRCLFSQSNELVYIGEDGEDYIQKMDTIKSLISDDDIHYVNHTAKELFKQKESICGNRTLLFSSEDIMTSHVPSLCAKRLFNFLPDAQILLVIRNQLTAIPSMYANHGAYLKNVPRRYWKRYVSFNEWMEYSTAFIKYSLLDSYFYDRMLSVFTPLFGKQNISILFYEDYVANPKQFIGQLSDILAINKDNALKLLELKRERKRVTARQMRYHRLCDYFGGRDLIQSLTLPVIKDMWRNYLDGGPPADGFMSNVWRDKIIELYKEDNKRLQDGYDVDLTRYGYPLPD